MNEIQYLNKIKESIQRLRSTTGPLELPYPMSIVTIRNLLTSIHCDLVERIQLLEDSQLNSYAELEENMYNRAVQVNAPN
jgi:hypothetical protein